MQFSKDYFLYFRGYTGTKVEIKYISDDFDFEESVKEAKSSSQFSLFMGIFKFNENKILVKVETMPAEDYDALNAELSEFF